MPRYVVRAADLRADRDAIIGVWRRNLVGSDERQLQAKFGWYYLQDPLGPSKCWVLETDGQEPIVGTAGLGLRCVKLGERYIAAGIASDFAVDRAHRTFQPALMLQKAVLGSLVDGGVQMVYGLPNSSSMPVFRRIGYQVPSCLSRYVEVLRSRRCLQRFRGVARVAPLIAPVVDAAMRVVSEGPFTARTGRLVEVRSFDERFDELWLRASGPLRFAARRDAGFLRAHASQRRLLPEGRPYLDAAAGRAEPGSPV